MLPEEDYEVVAGFAEAGHDGLVYMCHWTWSDQVDDRLWGLRGAIDLDGEGNVTVNECIVTYLDTGNKI